MTALINVDSIINQGELLSAPDAARHLGVKLATLYAYVSRGLVRATGGSRAGGHLYAREDLERLVVRKRARSGHAGAAASALRWGEPVLDSAITAIDARGPRYRGVLATELVRRGVGFEEAAAILWSRSGSWSVPARPLDLEAGAARKLLPRSPIGRLFGLLALAAAAHGEAESVELELERARGLIMLLACNAGVRVTPRRTVAETLARSLGLAGGERTRAAVDAALVLLADHELNASSFACRVAASTGAPILVCLTAGMAALVGPRHGRASREVERLIDSIATPRHVRVALGPLLRAGATLPGFGHPLYPAGDPRCPPLLEIARRHARGRRFWKIAETVSSAAARRGERPNVDFALTVLARALDAPRETAAVLFAIGRTAGWVAHALEQREAGFLLRPRARYVGVETATTLPARSRRAPASGRSRA